LAGKNVQIPSFRQKTLSKELKRINNPTINPFFIAIF